MKVILGFSKLGLCVYVFVFRKDPLSLEYAGLGKGEVAEIETDRKNYESMHEVCELGFTPSGPRHLV
jgi:hypothetical protein